MEQKENLLGVLNLIFQWRKPLVGLSFLVAVVTAAISLLLPNYYRSTTVFVAANPNLARPEIFFGKNNMGADLYGSDNDIDRILAIAESNELIDHLVDSFNLYTHYRINAQNPKAPYRVRMRFRKLYEVKKTKFNVLELSVEDRDPELAAAIANAARELVNLIGEGLVKSGQKATLESYEANILNKSGQVKVLGDSLARIRARFQIYNTAAQSEDLTEQLVETQSLFYRQKGRLESMRANSRISRDSVAYTEALVNGLQQEMDSINRKMSLLNEGQVLLSVLETQYFSANGQLGEDLERAKLLQAAYSAVVPSLILVEAAEVPVVKIRPKRSILVITAGILAFLMSLLAILLFHAYRNMEWRLIFKES